MDKRTRITQYSGEAMRRMTGAIDEVERAYAELENSMLWDELDEPTNVWLRMGLEGDDPLRLQVLYGEDAHQLDCEYASIEDVVLLAMDVHKIELTGGPSPDMLPRFREMHKGLRTLADALEAYIAAGEKQV